MDGILISIITVCFNAQETIRQTIQSVLDQTYQNIEYIIIDGKSTDHTMEIIGEYCDKISTVISEHDEGIYNAMNKGISLAHGEIIGIINADDWYEEDAVQNVVRIFTENPAIQILAGQVHVIENNKVIYDTLQKPEHKIWYQMPFPHPATFVRKNVYDMYGRYDEQYRISADYEFLLRCYSYGVVFRIVDDVFANFRSGGLSSNDRATMQETEQIAYRYLDQSPFPQKIKKYFEDARAMINFTELLHKDSDAILAVIKDHFEDWEKGISIFGTGSWANKLYHLLEYSDIPIKHLYDNNTYRCGKMFESHIVKVGSLLKNTAENVIIGVLDFEDEITAQLKGYHNPNLNLLACSDLIKKVTDKGTPTVSIVVTIYNKAAFLKKALESIISQSKKDIEIICVDDGSTDSSSEIIEEYAKRDSRIVVIHQANRGQVFSRKRGIEAAKAEYLGFVDADDWIAPEMYQVLYDEMVRNSLDFISSGIIRNGKLNCDRLGEGIYTVEQNQAKIFNHLFSSEGIAANIGGNAVTKLFKTSLLKESSKDIYETIHYREDDCFVYSYLVCCQRIGVLNKAFYYYHVDETSDSQKEDELFFSRANYFYLFLKDVFLKSKYADLLLPQLDRYIVQTLIEGINLRGCIDISSCVSIDFPLKNARRIVVYGNGEHGKKIIRKVMQNQNYYLVAVLDQRWKEFSHEEYKVLPIHYIREITFDIILLAVVNNKMQCEIIQRLIDLGVKKELIKII